METLSTISYDDYAMILAERKARLDMLQTALRAEAHTPESRLRRRLVARALYSTWLDLEELQAPVAVAH